MLLLTPASGAAARALLLSGTAPLQQETLAALPALSALVRSLRTSAGHLPDAGLRCFASDKAKDTQQPQQPQQQQEEGASQWAFMVSQGHKVNPCNSMLHPAVEAGIMPEGGEEMSVQSAYTPKSQCFGCGPAHPDGLHLASMRIENGLEARISLPSKYCAFPGILNGGVLSTLLDCHGNWTAAIALMDRSCLPKPPLTLTASMLVSYKEPTPPDTELVVRSHVVAVRENQNPGLGKAAVEVDVAILLPQPGGSEKLLVQGTGIFKRLGALRAL